MRPFCKCTPCVILTAVPCPAERSPRAADIPIPQGELGMVFISKAVTISPGARL